MKSDKNKLILGALELIQKHSNLIIDRRGRFNLSDNRFRA